MNKFKQNLIFKILFIILLFVIIVVAISNLLSPKKQIKGISIDTFRPSSSQTGGSLSSVNSNIPTDCGPLYTISKQQLIDQGINDAHMNFCITEYRCPDNLSGYVNFKEINPNTIVYTSAEDLSNLAPALGAPRNVQVLAGSIDNKLYGFADNPDSTTVYGKFKKDEVPYDLLRLKVEAQNVAYGIGLTTGAFISMNQFTTKISCGDVDYWELTALSPLIYLYPSKETAISVKINSFIMSPKTLLSDNSWVVVAQPDGTLTTLDGKKHQYIPYEFLRQDFKKPTKGFVVASNQLEEFLKESFWPKLGLKNQEIADYWIDTKPRVPKTAYYFISLIDRSEIDRVLPMDVNPKPDLIIRNMTYILALKSPIIPFPLEDKDFVNPSRKAFTVLENGVFIDGQ